MTKKELLESEAFKNAPDDAEVFLEDIFRIRLIRVDYDTKKNKLILI